MTLADLRAIAQFHRYEASTLADSLLTLEANAIGVTSNAEMVMYLRNRLLFHQKAAADLQALSDAFQTFGGLTADIPATGT